jgi:hypothetical protein
MPDAVAELRAEPASRNRMPGTPYALNSGRTWETPHLTDAGQAIADIDQHVTGGDVGYVHRRRREISIPRRRALGALLVPRTAAGLGFAQWQAAVDPRAGLTPDRDRVSRLEVRRRECVRSCPLSGLCLPP